MCTLCVKVMVRRIDNEGKTVWTALFGAGGNAGRSVGFAIAQVRVKYHLETGNVVLKVHVIICDGLNLGPWPM